VGGAGVNIGIASISVSGTRTASQPISRVSPIAVLQPVYSVYCAAWVRNWHTSDDLAGAAKLVRNLGLS